MIFNFSSRTSVRATGIAMLMGASAAAVLAGALVAGAAARRANMVDGTYAAIALAVGTGRADLLDVTPATSLAGGFTLRASLGGDFNPPAPPLYFKGGARDLQCLTEAVYYEARGEGVEGEEAVAQVVINRVRHPSFPKSICGVVYQHDAASGRCQFSFACDGSLDAAHEPAAWRKASRVAQRALSGFVMQPVGQATHFHTVSVTPAWGGRMMEVAQIGLHVFYRFGGIGSANLLRAEPRVSGPADGMIALISPAANAAGSAMAQTEAAPAAAPVEAPSVAGAAVPAAVVEKIAEKQAVVATVTPVIEPAKPQTAQVSRAS